MPLLTLLKSKVLLIGGLAIAVASATATGVATKIYWENKYQKLELSVKEDKLQHELKLKAQVAATYDSMLKDYNENFQRLDEINTARQVEADATEKKYRGLYASYVNLQRKTPYAKGCEVPADRAALLMLAGQQANKTRDNFNTKITTPTSIFDDTAPVPDIVPGRVRKNPPK